MKQVFVSYSFNDTHLSEEVSGALKKAGLNVSSVGSVKPGVDWATAVSAHIKSANCLVAVTSGSMNANLAFEIGVATALNKPVYVIVSNDIESLPRDFSWASSNVSVLPASNIDYARKIASEISQPT
jgi:hypothetical protein